MEYKKIESPDFTEWNNFVYRHPQSTLAHLVEWKEIIETVYKHEVILLAAFHENSLKGILTLVYMKSMIFGKRLVSVPYFTVGGILTDDREVSYGLLKEAYRLASEYQVSLLEIRNPISLDHIPESPGLAFSQFHGKSSMLLELPPSAEELFKNFKAKLRSQIRRPQKEGMEFKLGGQEKLADFYSVFKVNMRDLGSPVHKYDFFRQIVSKFEKHVKIGVVYFKGHPVAAGIIFLFNQTVEIPWASSLRKFNNFSPNMLLYWGFLSYSAENGYKVFDFGRSTPDEGTYRFKKQWGAHPVPVNWYYWSSKNQTGMPESPDSGLRKIATKVWTKLPVSVATVLGNNIRGDIAL